MSKLYMNKKQRQDLLYLRQTNNLIYDIVDIELKKEKVSSKIISNIEYEFLRHSKYMLEKSLPAIIKEHYCAYPITYWKLFLKTWLLKITNCVIIYTSRDLMPTLFTGNKKNNVIICGIMFYMQKERLHDIYIRLLCSNSFCGGKLLQHVISKYQGNDSFDRISLNSEPNSIQFYKKHGFVITNKFYLDFYGIRYPYMVRPTGDKLILDKDERIETGYWPGLAFYIYTYWFALLIIGIIILVLYTLFY